MSRTDSFMILIKDYVLSCLPEEGCGLLAGINNEVKAVFFIENIDHKNDSFIMNPLQQLEAFKRIDSLNYQLLAIFHSHPDGSILPSDKDLQELFYPEVHYLIFGVSKGNILIAEYLLQNKKFVKTSQILTSCGTFVE